MRFLLFLLTAVIANAGSFTTSIGDTYPFIPSAIATDSAGNTYVVGNRQVPAVNPAPGLQAGPDVFLTKLDPNGNVLFTDLFGGNGYDVANAIALDPSGNIYIGGTTTSPDFPLSQALQVQPGSGASGFIMKIETDGSIILYSTYFGGTLGASSISGLATDTKGNLYVTGNTNSSDFPQTSGLPNVQFVSTNGVTSGTIVAEIPAAGDKILYSGLIPSGGGTESGNGTAEIAVDAAGNAYIASNTAYPNLPVATTGAPGTGGGTFIAKVNAGGAGFGYVTYIPGSGSVTAVTVDAAGNAYLAGYVPPNSSFPTTPGSLQPVLQPVPPPVLGETPSEGFLAELNPTGSAFVWATYLPGGCGGEALSIALDASANVWSTGTVASNCTVPNINGWAAGNEFLFGVNATGSALVYSALYPTGSVAQSVAVDPSGLVHVAGTSGFISAISPTTPASTQIFGFQNAFGGSLTARISPAEVIAIYGPGIGPAAAVTASPANGFYPTSLAGVQVAINGVNVPLLYVSANQINAVALMELSSNAAATVRVTNGTTVSPDYPVWIVSSAPFANPTVLNQDGTINSQSNPAHGGSFVTFWVTGWQSNFPLADGQVQSVANNDACQGSCTASAQPVGSTGNPFGGPVVPLPATVLYGGAAPELVVGVTQFNVQLGIPPSSSVTNLSNVSITSGLTNSTVAEGVYIVP
jgi:uncharacterized protein (TIGR03437 family)